MFGAYADCNFLLAFSCLWFCARFCLFVCRFGFVVVVFFVALLRLESVRGLAPATSSWRVCSAALLALLCLNVYRGMGPCTFLGLFLALVCARVFLCLWFVFVGFVLVVLFVLFCAFCLLSLLGWLLSPPPLPH